jgi:hypothetical protein
MNNQPWQTPQNIPQQPQTWYPNQGMPPTQSQPVPTQWPGQQQGQFQTQDSPYDVRSSVQLPNMQPQQGFQQPLSQPSFYGQPPQSPEKSPKTGFFKKKITLPLWVAILTLVIVLGLLGNVLAKSGTADTSQNNSNVSTTNQNSNTASTQTVPTAQPTQVPTKAPTPTHTPQWTTVQTFTGNGTKKTAVFNVGNDWKIIWSCNPSSSFGGQYNVIVDVNNADATPLDPGAVNTICKAGNTGDMTEEHQGGDVYLDVSSEGSWKILVQVLK